MKVSIITATCNSAATIKETLLSIKAQSYPVIEHLVIDGASGDDTIGIVKQMSKDSLIVSEPDRGMYHAMNKGINMASGDIIGILNSDDHYADEHVIADVVKQFETTNCDAMYGDLVYFNPANANKITRRWTSGAFRRERFLKGWMPPHPTFFVKREIYEQYGLYNTVFKTAADYELLIRFLYIQGIQTSYLNRVLVHMRSGGSSNKDFKSRVKAHLEDYRAWSFNNIQPKWYTVILKPLRKVWQYV